MKPYLQDLALDFFTTCLSNSITVDIQWIPTTENREADAISKMINYDDWGSTQVLFQYLNVIWGLHTIDRFAHNKNAKVSRFNSKFWCPALKAFINLMLFHQISQMKIIILLLQSILSLELLIILY